MPWNQTASKTKIAMDRNRKIVHIDMDAFFASVEQQDNPRLQGRPVIVGGPPQSRGVVATCSYEARRYGIHSAMPCARAARLCPQAIFVSPRMGRYKEISSEIMAIFHRYTASVEPLSLDEAFLDLTDNRLKEPSASIIAQKIRKEITQSTGLTASAGVSCNKFLAKMASDVNKPDGITVVPPEQALDFVAQLPITAFYGVGKATAAKMQRLGVTNGADLRRFSKEELNFHFGKSGNFFYHICRGIDHREVKTRRIRKSIGKEKTFAADLIDKKTISKILQQLAATVAAALAAHDALGYTLVLKIRYHDFRTITRSVTTKTPMANSTDILYNLPRLLPNTELGRIPVRLLGLTVANLINRHTTPYQLRLPFDTPS